MNETQKFTISCRAIILHEGKLLLVKHPHDMSYTALPGGHLEWGENPKECLEREIVEELGVKPEIGRLLYVSTFLENEHTQPLEFFFEVTNGEQYANTKHLQRTHAHELKEIIWAKPTDDIRILPEKLGEDFREGRILADEIRYIKS